MPQQERKAYHWFWHAGIFGYLFLVSLGFYLLYTSRTGASILSPWQTIHPAYIYVFFAATLVLGMLIIKFSSSQRGGDKRGGLESLLKRGLRRDPLPAPPFLKKGADKRTLLLLFLLVIHSLLLHSYLPLTHDLIYGADGWRHMANEQRMLEGLLYLPAKTVEEASLSTRIGGLSYRPFWFISVAAAKITTLDLLTVNKWLLPIVWSIVFPLLMFAIGRKIQAAGTPPSRQANIPHHPSQGGIKGGVRSLTSSVGLEDADLPPADLTLLTAAQSDNRGTAVHTPSVPLKGDDLGLPPLAITDRWPLFLVWLSFLPFAFQAGGSFTLPVNMGFLIWLAEILLIIKYLQNPTRKQLYMLLGLGVLSVFNYTLFFILYWVGLGLAAVLSVIARNPDVRRGDAAIPLIGVLSKAGGLLRRSPRGSLLAMTLLAALVLPLLELLAGYSYFSASINWLAQIKQLIGNFTAFYLAAGLRPHDILTGNIIFNQTPSYAYVANVFIVWRWWLVPFMIAFIGLAKFGWWKLWKRGEPASRWLCILGAGLFGSYVISRYFLAGENILTRRLDIVLALFFVIFVAAGVSEIMKYRNNEIKNRLFPSFFISLFLLIFSLAIAASYSVGPDTRTVSIDQYKAMKYVWSEEKNNEKHCVIADAYPLLALEVISAKKIIGGGFPINTNFAQPERELIYHQMVYGNDPTPVLQARSITGTERCWYVSVTGRASKLWPIQ